MICSQINLHLIFTTRQRNCEKVMFLQASVILSICSTIHKAAGSLVTSRSLQNRKVSMGNHRTECPPDLVLYGGRQSGGFVNSALNTETISSSVSKKLCSFLDV